MILEVKVDERTFPIEVPQQVLDDGEPFFAKMDHDMNAGWQMSRHYIDNPNVIQRCQIAADRLLSAMHMENQSSLLMMAGYILKRMPKVNRIDIDTTGNMEETEFHFDDS